jgi:hypothetical protein
MPCTKRCATGRAVGASHFRWGFFGEREESVLAHFEEWYHPPVSRGELEKQNCICSISI